MTMSSVCLSVCPSVCLPILPSLCVALCFLSLSPRSVSSLSLSLALGLSLCLSMCVFLSLSLCLSVSVSVSLSLCLSGFRAPLFDRLGEVCPTTWQPCYSGSRVRTLRRSSRHRLCVPTARGVCSRVEGHAQTGICRLPPPLPALSLSLSLPLPLPLPFPPPSSLRFPPYFLPLVPLPSVLPPLPVLFLPSPPAASPTLPLGALGSDLLSPLLRREGSDTHGHPSGGPGLRRLCACKLGLARPHPVDPGQWRLALPARPGHRPA